MSDQQLINLLGSLCALFFATTTLLLLFILVKGSQIGSAFKNDSATGPFDPEFGKKQKEDSWQNNFAE